MDATLGQDPQLNTHSDGFDGALRHGGGYGHVYYKTAVMLYNLQYVLVILCFWQRCNIILTSGPMPILIQKILDTPSLTSQALI